MVLNTIVDVTVVITVDVNYWFSIRKEVREEILNTIG